MERHVEALPAMVDRICALRDIIIANIVLIGQVPAPTFQEKQRCQKFMNRLLECEVDECTTDGYRNPLGIVRGLDPAQPPILVAAHLDTHFSRDVDHDFTITEERIIGAGVLDNSVGVGVLASLPLILKRLGVRFQSDLLLAGVIQSLGRGNLRGMRHLVKTWATPIRGAVCIEGVELGRLNYYADGMIRGEVTCRIDEGQKVEMRHQPNAILVLHEVINQILEIRLPQKPHCHIIIGKIAGGLEHGISAYEAELGFEIQSNSDRMVKSVFTDIADIVTGIGHEYGVELTLETISNLSAARLRYNHPLVKAAGTVMETLGLKPQGAPSESELSILLSRRIPAVTLGLTRGENFHQINSAMEIAPVFTGIAQVLGVIAAIDRGLADD
jgi:acetylornithine deacetylase/succinyl-diaminopimelate desuccinylase-like protein